MRYDPALDGIRAIAILTVLAFHAGVPGMNGGFLGVDVFFVLSGFLITRILSTEHHETGTVALGAFWRRRLRRLFPPMALLVVVFVLTAHWLFPKLTAWQVAQDAFLSLFYVSDYRAVFGIKKLVLNQTWSLAIEEKFYLLWPLLALGIFRLPKRQAIIALTALYIAATLWRWYVMGHGPGHWRVYTRFDTHATGLILGCVLGLANPRASRPFGLAGLLLIAYMVGTTSFRSWSASRYGFAMTEIGTAMLIAGRGPLLAINPLPWIGKMSYGLYLWHYPAMLWLKQNGYSWKTTLAIGAAFALAGALISYHTVEKWFRSRRSVDLGRKESLFGSPQSLPSS